MGASSRSPSPITIVPSMSTLSISLRIDSTATWSEYLRSPWPMVRAAAMAALSTTLTNSRNRSSRCIGYFLFNAESAEDRRGRRRTMMRPCRDSSLSSLRASAASALNPFRRSAFVGRQLDAAGLVLPEAQGVVGLHELVDLAGPFVDDGGLGVAVEAARRVLVGIAVAAVDLHAVGGRPLALHGGEPLGEGRLAGVAAALVLEPARPQPEQAGRVVVGDHLRDHLLDELVLADGPAEGLPLPGVLRRRVQASADEAGRPRGHGVAAVLEREHRDPEALALLPEPVLRRHLHVVHREAAGVAGDDPPLLLDRVRAEALERALHDEGAEPAVVPALLLLLVGPGEDDEVVGDVGEADPHLLAVEDVTVALAHRGGLDADRIAPRVGLGEPVGGDLLPPRLGGQVLLLLVVAAPAQERHAVEAHVQGFDPAQGGVDLSQPLAHATEVRLFHPRPAPLLGDADAEQVQIGHALE